jgi:uncharacterized protein (DUF3084 family)
MDYLTNQALPFGLVAFIAAAISALVTLYLAGANRRHLDAKTGLATTTAAMEVMDRALALANELQEERVQVTRARQDLEIQLASLQTEISELKAGVLALSLQLRELGQEPMWEPSL